MNKQRRKTLNEIVEELESLKSEIDEVLNDRQSRDAFWGYAMSNEWDYFVTLTTDKLKVDRYDDAAVYKLLTLFCQRIQRADKNAKILLVPERHKDGALHFHGLVACKSFMLVPFCLKDNKQKYSSCGSPLFVFPYWNYGLAICVVLSHNDFVFDSEKDTIAPYARDESGGVRSFSQREVVAYLDSMLGSNSEAYSSIEVSV